MPVTTLTNHRFVERSACTHDCAECLGSQVLLLSNVPILRQMPTHNGLNWLCNYLLLKPACGPHTACVTWSSRSCYVAASAGCCMPPSGVSMASSYAALVSKAPNPCADS